MYTVSKGPSKIVAKTRRGISQNLERLDTLRDARKSTDSKEDQDYVINTPKPVFHMNGKKSNHNRYHQEVISPQHEEIIKFIYDSWTTVCKECEVEPQEDGQSPQPPSPVYYNDCEPSELLQDFKPFDLESWWGKRLFNNITKSIP
ncbi:MAPK regulated corepressor interacting protein 2 [Thrips palmi]|uniref:MAPK regulated corepressor interacting protein 2 n=1 Tax=Thrips palmi TaxID=161013 RepID=A0A6P8YTM2_THRPL|nr:MAPK regulated corepressor interacting protein 2 [Thrips palmi]